MCIKEKTLPLHILKNWSLQRLSEMFRGQTFPHIIYLMYVRFIGGLAQFINTKYEEL